MVVSELKELTLVNSFRGSGIGDFGWKLKGEFKNQLRVRYLEITPSWIGLISLWRKLIHYNSRVLFNVGFTSLGNSTIRNFLNFLIIGLLSATRVKPSVILHDSIDTSNLEISGYSNSWIISFGAAIATRMLKNCEIFVFSKSFRGILEEKYGFKHVNYFPFPSESETISECYNQNKEPMLLSIGYVAPYKGLDILPEIRRKLNNVETTIVGNFHKRLLSTKGGIKFGREFVKLMKDSGIRMPGYMEDTRLIEFVKEHRTIALLPYISGYNASYSAIFFVRLGIPVIATNIDVFSESRDNGAGLILVDRTSDAFVATINKLLKSPELIEELIEKDRKYCSQYSMTDFCNITLGVLDEREEGMA
ncbi:MAG: glycosyltransferase [Leptospirales bacterium]